MKNTTESLDRFTASYLFGSVECGGSRLAPPKANSPKQRAIIADVTLNGIITLAEATALVGRNVYANAEKHTGALLANMVKKGLLVRLKPGVFSLPNAKAQAPKPAPENDEN